MRDLDVIETINRDQLVTPMDRLLLRRGRLPPRDSTPFERTELVRLPRPHVTRALAAVVAFAFAVVMLVTL